MYPTGRSRQPRDLAISRALQVLLDEGALDRTVDFDLLLAGTQGFLRLTGEGRTPAPADRAPCKGAAR
jgi:hypothetical protein